MKEFILTLIVLGGITAICCSGSRKIDNTPVREFNLNRFLGHWYEIARYPHSFERDQHHVSTFYKIRNDGKISVLNTGIKRGVRKDAMGKAKITKTTGLLRVSFFGPFYSDYRVLMVTPDYRHAIVGGGTDKFLWILSRDPEIHGETMDAILTEIKRRGYDPARLEWIDQSIDEINDSN